MAMDSAAEHGSPSTKASERYWTLVAEMEVPSLDVFMALGQGGEDAEAFEEIMRGYHDLVESGRRELYTIEGE